MSTIILLHGASSSGKSTLAQAIRATSPTPFVHLSLDHFRDSGAIDPDSYSNWHSARPAVFEGLHQSFAAFANAGCDVIIEHILDTKGWHLRLQDLLCQHDILFVGVETPEAVLAAREDHRGDRPIGSAVKDAAHVHLGLTYDLVVDGTQPPTANAQEVLAALERQMPQPSTFFKR